MGRKRREPEISEQALCAEYEAVYRYALALCRSEADAQDIAQETILKAMSASGDFAGQSSLYEYVYLLFPDGHEEYWSCDGERLDGSPAME